MTLESQVLFEIKNSVGWITLNRPQCLHALSYEMIIEIRDKLQEWKMDKDIQLICLQGTGGKALCAGADIKALYEEKKVRGSAGQLARNYFTAEYAMDHLIHTYPKPVIVIMDGIVMGGGVGLSIGCRHRIATEKTKWAMPEMNIGFFPDVGASYFLNKMPGHIGRYLALTAKTVSPADALYLGTADRYVSSSALEDFVAAIREKDWSVGSVSLKLEKLLRTFEVKCPEQSFLQEVQDKIDEHFAYDYVEDIVSSLKRAALAGCSWALETLAHLQEKSPTSLKVTLEQLKRGKNLSLEECFQMEVELSVQFMQHHDFFEGVRAILVEKDKNPQWLPTRLEDVSESTVESYFPVPVKTLVASDVS